MNRAFLSLYCFIVFSVIAVGWGMDKLWEAYSVEDNTNPAHVALVEVVEFSLQGSAIADSQTIKAISENQGLEIVIFDLDDMAKSDLRRRLLNDELVTFFVDDNTQYLYKRIRHSQQILRVTLPYEAAPQDFLQLILLIVFYASIALAVFLWVWPLSRDLHKLEFFTKKIGKDKLTDKLDVYSGSAVYPVAQAFNRMAERIRELIATQKEMTYAVSHELRTPLARMKFGLEMAEDSDDITQIKKQLVGVREDVSEMDALVSSLLNYASYDSEDSCLDVQTGDMPYLIQHLLTQSKQTAESNSLKMQFVDELSEKALVHCEWGLMEVVIQNLIQNAVRYAEREVCLCLSQDRDCWQLIVDDDGAGIPEDERERVFQSFVRLSNAVNGKSRGFGLGLALVRRIMQWHGGSVHVEAAPIGGARFVLRWPCDMVQEKDASA